MKMIRYVLVAALAMGFAGCLDIDEKIDLRQDGSGTLTLDTDLGQVLGMMQEYMGKDELAKRGMSKTDTTIEMRDVLAADTSLPADKKALLAAGSVHLKVDMDAKICTIHMRFPFNSQAQLQKLYAALGDGSLGKTQLLQGLGGAAVGGAGGGGAGGGGPDVNRLNGVYDFTSHDGLISKKVNAEKWKALMDDPQIAQVKQIAGMGTGMEINYTTTIALPRPVRKVDNPLAKLSADKKTVSMKVNLVDVLDHPERFGYTVEY